MLTTPSFQSVECALQTGQIGEPVSVRLIANLAEDSKELTALTELLSKKVATWLDDSVTSSFALGDSSFQHSRLLRTSTGRMALISGGTCVGGKPLVEVVVFGTRGMMSWEDSRNAIHASHDQTSKSEDLSSTSCMVETGVKKQAPSYGVLLVSGDHTHQPGYAEALVADGRCQLVGIADEEDISDERLALNQRLADRLEIPLLPSLQDALKRDDIHIVSVCAEPYRRGRIIVEAARAGKHLYLDKPLAGSVEDADAIVDAVHESGVVAHMFTQVHWDPAQRVRQIIESGELGEITAIHCDVCFAKGHGGTADLAKIRVEQESPTRFELPDAKRELTNVGVYPIAMLLWLLRDDVKSVTATTGNFFFAEHQANDMEDFGQMLMEFQSGITATISAGRAGWRSHPGFGLHRVCIVGSKGSVTIDAHRPRVEVWADSDAWTAPPRDPDDPMGMWAPLPNSPYKADPKETWILPTTSSWATDAKHFLDCIEHGRQSEVSVEVAAAATKILFAAYRSAATHSVIDLPAS